MKYLNVLLLEDNALDAELNQVELQTNLKDYQCHFQWVTNKKDYHEILDSYNPDIVLSDYNLPSYSGLEALRDFKTKFPFTPFIFVTGTQQEEVAAESIKEGAWDYVVKDRLSRLTMAVQNTLRLREEQLKNTEIQEAVAKSELRFRTLFNSASDAIFMMQGPLFIDCNSATEKIFGCVKDQIVGQTPILFSPLVQPSGIPSQIAAMEKIQNALAGHPQFFEWMHQKYDGTLFDAEVSLNRLDIGGEIFIQAIVRDITKRKQIDVALKQKNEELLKINSELDRFVYSASHDLRAPIASLLGLVQVARLEKEINGIGKLLDMQERSLLKLDSFIHDIVNYSRNNRLEIEPVKVDLKIMINEIFEQLYFMDHLVQIEFKTEVPSDLVFYGDIKRVEVILANLISNAIKYADIHKPKPFVEVRVERRDNGILICVVDNGEGIDAAQLPKIFDMFYRATLRSTGSGIGLYIVNEIIQKMKGTIDVKSIKGEGSQFLVSLPNMPISQ